MEGIIVLAITLGGSVALALAISSFISLCYDVTEKKRKKAHPQLWVWFDEINETQSAEVHYHNDNITPLRNQIDRILANWNYYPTETKSQKEEELETLRKRMEAHMIVYKTMCAETQKIRDKIHNYVETNDLKWARDWGW